MVAEAPVGMPAIAFHVLGAQSVLTVIVTTYSGAELTPAIVRLILKV